MTPKETGVADKRDIQRKLKRLKVRYGTEALEKMGFTNDLSHGGLFIKTAAPLAPGELLHMQLFLPNEEEVHCTGRIHWAKRVPASMLRLVGKGGMGVRIVGFSAGQQAYRSFIESLHR